MGAIKNVEPGVTLQIIMQAVNGGNQGVASATPKAVPAPQVAELKAIVPNGNGNGNGHRVATRA